MKKVGLLAAMISLLIGEIYGVVMIQQAKITTVRSHKVPVMLAPSFGPNPPLIQLLEKPITFVPRESPVPPEYTQLKYYDVHQEVLTI